MDRESFGVVGFDLGPLLQGQMRIAKLKSACNSFIIGLIICFHSFKGNIFNSSF